MSPDALTVARANAGRLGLDVGFAQADLLEGVEGPVDAVLSNPPYVAEGQRAALPPDVVRHEPPGALFAGPDGLGVIARLVPAAAARAPLVALEVGEGQAGGVAALLREVGLGEVEARRDLAGVERVVVGRRGA